MHCRNNARARASKLAAGRRDDGSRRSRVIRRVTLLVGAGVVAAAGAQSAAAAGWSIDQVPQLAHSSDAELSGVSCISRIDCVAVGQSVVPSTDEPIPVVEHWNGSSWSNEHAPLPRRSDSSGGLSGVSCISSTACIAVGFRYSETSGDLGSLAERWNGSSWSIQRTPRLADGDQFDDVSCVSITDCIAVGGNGLAPIAERWDGRGWSVQNLHFGDPDGRPNALMSVSCAPGRCAVVGWDNVGICGEGVYNGYDPPIIGSVPVFGFWTDRGWSLVRRPNFACSNNGGDILNAVSCASATTCTAVGTKVYRWNGRHWSVQAAPIGGELTGVSCPSTDACTAIGSRIDTWDGRRWSTVQIPRPADAVARELTAVSCPSRATCVAVGGYIDHTLNGDLLIESRGVGATPAMRARRACPSSER